MECEKEISFIIFLLTVISSLILRIFCAFTPHVWHLWQQKINIAVGRRAYTRAREHTPLFCHYALSLLWVKCNHTFITMRFWKIQIAKWIHLKNYLSLFGDLFTLWGYIFPYTYRGLREKADGCARNAGTGNGEYENKNEWEEGWTQSGY